MEKLEEIVIESRSKLDSLIASINNLDKDSKTNLKVANDALNLSQELNRRFDRHLPEIKEQLSYFIEDVKDQTSPIWRKLDKHSDKLFEHAGTLKWIIGVGLGLQVALGIFIGFIKYF